MDPEPPLDGCQQEEPRTHTRAKKKTITIEKPKRKTRKHVIYTEPEEVSMDFSPDEADGDVDYDISKDTGNSSDTDGSIRDRLAKKKKKPRETTRIKRTPGKRSKYSTVSDQFLQKEFPNYIYNPSYYHVLPSPREIKAALGKKNCPESLKKKEIRLIKHKVRNLRTGHQTAMAKAKKKLEYE